VVGCGELGLHELTACFDGGIADGTIAYFSLIAGCCDYLFLPCWDSLQR
jgi:hypothetical protein